MCKSCVTIYLKNPPANLPEYCYDSDGRVRMQVGALSLEKSKRLEELSDLNSITSEGILGFELLDEACNRAILKKFGCASSYNRSNSLCLEVIVVEGSMTLRQNLLSVLQKTNNGWEVELIDGQDFWKTALADCKLCDLDFPTIVYDENTVMESWDNPQYADGDDGYYFPLVHYGNWFQPAIYADDDGDDDNGIDDGELTETTVVSVEDFRPWFHALAIMQKAFCKVGWEFCSPIFETDWGRRLIVSFFSDLSDANKDLFGFKASTVPDLLYLTDTTAGIGGLANLQVFLLPFTDDSTGTNYDNGQAANGIGFFDPAAGNNYGTGMSGTYDITIDLNYTIPVASDVFVMVVVSDAPSNSFFIDDINDDFYYTPIVQAPAGTNTYNGTTTIQIEPGQVVRAYVFFRNVPLTGVVVPTIHSASMEAEIVEFELMRGAIVPLSAFIDCDKDFISFFEGMLHLIGKGKLITDFVNKKVTTYHPENVEISDGSTPEAFYNNNLTTNCPLPLICKISNITPLANENNRYYELAFSRSQDCYVTDILRNEKLHSNTVDFGDDKNYIEETTTNENGCFEPTGQIIADDLTSSEDPNPQPGPTISRHVEIPAVWDNCDHEVTENAGPRIAYAAGLVSQFRGTDSNGAPILADWIFDSSSDGTNPVTLQEVPFIFQLTDQAIFDGTTASVPTENVVYGGTQKDLYSLFWSQYLAELRSGLQIEHQALLSNCKLESIKFRKLWDVVYEGKHYRAKLLDLSGFSNCPTAPGSMVFAPLVNPVEICDEEVEDDIIIEPCPAVILSNGAIEQEITDLCNQNLFFKFDIDAPDCCTLSDDLDNTIELTGEISVDGVVIGTSNNIATWNDGRAFINGLLSTQLCDLKLGDIIVVTIKPGDAFSAGSDCVIDNQLEPVTEKFEVTEAMLACCEEPCPDVEIVGGGAALTINPVDDGCEMKLIYTAFVEIPDCCTVNNLEIQARRILTVNGVEVYNVAFDHQLVQGNNNFEVANEAFLNVCDYEAGDVLEFSLIFSNLVFDADCGIVNNLEAVYTSAQTITEGTLDLCQCCPDVELNGGAAELSVFQGPTGECDVRLRTTLNALIPDCCTVNLFTVDRKRELFVNGVSTLVFNNTINVVNGPNAAINGSPDPCDFEVGDVLRLEVTYNNIQYDGDCELQGGFGESLFIGELTITQQNLDDCGCCGDVVLNGGQSSLIINDDCDLEIGYELEADLPPCCDGSVTVEVRKQLIFGGLTIYDENEIYQVLDGQNTLSSIINPPVNLCDFVVGDTLTITVFIVNVEYSGDCVLDNQLLVGSSDSLTITQQNIDDCGGCCDEVCAIHVNGTTGIMTFCTAQNALDYYNSAAPSFNLFVNPGGLATLSQTANPLELTYAPDALLPNYNNYTGFISIETQPGVFFTCQYLNGNLVI